MREKKGYPPDGTMLVLLGLSLGSTIEVIDGNPHLRINQSMIVPMKTESLDVLEHERGWIDVIYDQPKVTGAGRIHLEKWMKSRGRRISDYRSLRLTARRF